MGAHVVYRLWWRLNPLWRCQVRRRGNLQGDDARSMGFPAFVAGLLWRRCCENHFEGEMVPTQREALGGETRDVSWVVLGPGLLDGSEQQQRILRAPLQWHRGRRRQAGLLAEHDERKLKKPADSCPVRGRRSTKREKGALHQRLQRPCRLAGGLPEWYGLGLAHGRRPSKQTS